MNYFKIKYDKISLFFKFFIRLNIAPLTTGGSICRTCVAGTRLDCCVSFSPSSPPPHPNSQPLSPSPGVRQQKYC